MIEDLVSIVGAFRVETLQAMQCSTYILLIQAPELAYDCVASYLADNSKYRGISFRVPYMPLAEGD